MCKVELSGCLGIPRSTVIDPTAYGVSLQVQFDWILRLTLAFSENLELASPVQFRCSWQPLTPDIAHAPSVVTLETRSGTSGHFTLVCFWL